ncbi:MAG TPA: TonB-dependent receptor [Longimicrobium sp.]
MPSRTWRSALAALLLALTPLAAAAQGTGQVAGRVLDAQTGRALPAARVAVQGTQAAASTGVDGRYLLRGVPAGEQALVVTLLGYAPKTVTGVRVAAGGAAGVDVTLSAQGIRLGGITATATRERGSVNRALDEQRTATGVVNSVTAEQIARSPDGDAAQAVQRVSGVTVQDGRYVFVRGLGERYTTTSLNGARIPSPEPERKVVPLDLFPSGLLSAITTSKTFTPDQPGDFSGAQVNIRTREAPQRPFATLSLSTGFSSAVTGKRLPFAPTVGQEWLGYAGADRRLPAILQYTDLGGRLTADDKNRLISSMRNAWSPTNEAGKPNGSASLSFGGSTDVFGRELGLVASGTYSHVYEAHLGEVRATAQPDADGNAVEASRFTGRSAQTSVLWGGIANLTYRLGNGSRIDLSNSYNRSADNEGRSEVGSTENLARIPLLIDRLRFVERAVRSNQLRGEHLLFGRGTFSWSVSNSAVDRVEPDRSEIVYSAEDDPATGEQLAPAWYGGSNEAAVRTFGELHEKAWEWSGDWQWMLGRGARPHRIKLGGLYRATDRDADNRSFSISAPGTLGREAREGTPEEIFDGHLTAPGQSILNITSLSAGGSYDARDRLSAGYGMLELFLTPSVRLVGGARVERSEVTVNATPTFGDPVRSEPRYTDVLPSVALNWALTDEANLRLSYSRTLSRPEYREIAPILYRNVLGDEEVRGNEELRRTLIDNFDLRWELYPGSGEVLSVALFAKRFTDPIERVYLATSGTPIVTFVNARGARNYGVEMEARRELGFVAPWLERMTFFTNATVMKSRIDIGTDISSQTNSRRPMVGQSPYVVNAGLTWTGGDRGTSATLLYNVAGRRIVSAAERPLPDSYEQPRSVLDFSLRLPLRRAMDLKVDAENLLDSPFEIRQGGVVRERYTTGRSLGLGIAVRQ